MKVLKDVLCWLGKFNMNKSSIYQFRLLELSSTYKQLSNFSNEDGLSNILEMNSIDERIIIFQDELLMELKSIIENKLTKKQKQTLYLFFSGLTQDEIALKLKISQTAVHYCLFGKKVNEYMIHGGVVKKLKFHTNNNKTIQSILKKIELIKKEVKE